jgi:hypothetical protein
MHCKQGKRVDLYNPLLHAFYQHVPTQFLYPHNYFALYLHSSSTTLDYQSVYHTAVLYLGKPLFQYLLLENRVPY